MVKIVVIGKVVLKIFHEIQDKVMIGIRNLLFQTSHRLALFTLIIWQDTDTLMLSTQQAW